MIKSLYTPFFIVFLKITTFTRKIIEILEEINKKFVISNAPHNVQKFGQFRPVFEIITYVAFD